MKKLLLISALLFSFNGWAQVSDEIHQRCKDAADYVGCVQISTGSVPTKDNSSEVMLEAATKLAGKNKPTLSAKQATNLIKQAVKIINSDKPDKQEAKELLKENITSVHKKAGLSRSTGDLELFSKTSARIILAKLLIEEEDYDEAKKHLKTVIESDVHYCGACNRNSYLRQTFIDQQLKAVNLLEQIE